MRDGAAAVENGMAGPQNRTIELLWGTDPKELKAGFRQMFVRPRSRQHHPKSQEAGASHVSIDRERINEMWSFPDVEYYSALKREGNPDTR